MNRSISVFVGPLLGVTIMGCARITTQVVEKPRVDQELEGNRGFLVGVAPEPAPRKSTRKIVQTDVELPTAQELNPWRVQKAAPGPVFPPSPETLPVEAPETIGPWEVPLEQPRTPPAVPPRMEGSTYTVKSGDTLEKIAFKVYGDANQWRRIYKANRDKLTSPNRIYPGQKLMIPPAEEERTTAPPAGEFK